MTLIVSCLAHGFVVQVSDKLLVEVDAAGRIGKPVEQEATKAILLGRHMMWGYTGLANIDRQPTDYWLLQRLSLDLGHSIPRIRDDATAAFASVRREFRRHAFVGVGWEIAPNLPPRAAYIVISNMATEAWSESPAESFSVYVGRLPKERPYALKAHGQPLTERETASLVRATGRAVPHGPIAVARTIVKAVKEVAHRNDAVGDRLLVGIIPREAPTTSGAGVVIPMPGTGGIDAPQPPPERDAHAPRFFYVPGMSSEELVAYGPHVTDGNMMIGSPVFAAGEAAEAMWNRTQKPGGVLPPGLRHPT